MGLSDCPSSVFLTILVLIFGRLEVFVWLLGFFALGLESTLPLPQFITLVTFLFNYLSHLSPFSNYKQKSLYGFRASTLVGWVGGDTFKCGHLSTQLVFPTEISIFVGWSTSSRKGHLYNSKFVPFSSCRWTLVGDLRLTAEAD